MSLKPPHLFESHERLGVLNGWFSVFVGILALFGQVLGAFFWGEKKNVEVARLLGWDSNLGGGFKHVNIFTPTSAAFFLKWKGYEEKGTIKGTNLGEDFQFDYF